MLSYKQMKVNLLGTNIYKSKLLKRGLEFASDNGALFGASVSLGCATVVRPLAIYSTPKTDKENRKLACAKSFSSSAVGFGLMCGVSLPLGNSIKKINNAPEKYLKQKTITNLKEAGKPLTASKGYQFSTQLFKLGIGAVTAIPKAIITCALIPPIMGLFFNQGANGVNGVNTKDNQSKTTPKKNSPTFTGLPKEPLTKGIAKIINSDNTQKLAEKLKDTNYAMHIATATDTLATGTFIYQTKKNPQIKEDRKKPLMYNAGISTGLSIGASYCIDKVTEKPAEKFINKFSEINKESPKLEKYVEGIKIAKPLLILGTVYYGAIPFVSTFLAERLDNKQKNKAG